MSKRYAKDAFTGCRVEYIGKKRRNDCIKTIQVEGFRRRLFFPINFLLFSPDGTRILSNSERGACIWDVTSGKLIAGPLAGDDKKIALFATYLPDGRYIIVAGRGGAIRKWDVLTSRLVWERKIYSTHEPISMAFSPNRKLIVFGDCQGTIRVWNVDTWKRDGEALKGHTGYINCLSFSPNGKYLASGSDDTTVTIWDMGERRTKTYLFRKHTEGIDVIKFSPNGNNVVSGSVDKNIYVWDVTSGEVLREIECMRGISSIAYSPDGIFILATGMGWMSMWDVTHDTTAPKTLQVDRHILQASFSPNGSRFALMNGRNEIQIWDASWSMEETKSTFEEQGQIENISLSFGGNFIASGSVGGSIYLWNALTGELVKKIELGSRIKSASFSPFNEQLIAFGSSDGAVKLWDVTNDVIVTIGSHERSVTSIVFSPSNEKHAASGSDDTTIRIWNIERRELAVRPLRGHRDTVSAIAYSPDGTRLVSGSSDKTVRIWNSETGHLLSILHRHYDSVKSIGYSPNGPRILSASLDNTIRVLDAQSGQIICGPINGHNKLVDSMCFSPDGTQILSGSDDKTARVWDAITGLLLFPPFSGHTHRVSSICFSPDGRHFATGSDDRTIRIWTLDTIPNDTTWELRDDNWVVSESGKLLMWIPNDLHKYLCRHRNISILNRPFYLKLHFGTENNIGHRI